MTLPYLELGDQFASQFAANVAFKFPTWAIVLFAVLVIWGLTWKFLGMWKAARKGSIVWFIVIAVTNTMGILPILYLYIFSEMGKKKSVARPARRSTRKKRR